MIIETLTGLPFDEFLTQQLFRPLGMSTTCFGDYKQVVLGRTSLYTRLEIRNDALVPSPDQLWPYHYRCPAYAYPCAGLNTTVGDLLKLSIIVLSNCQGAEPITLLEGVAAHYLPSIKAQE